LTDAGRQQARIIGQAIKALKIPVGQVLSSPYCRAREYAQLLFDKPPQVEPSLVLPDPLPPAQQLQNTAALRAVLAAARPGASNIFLVAHAPNMRQAADIDLPVEGGAAIMRVQNATPEVVARLLPTEWTDLATALTSS
jgi:phosphohistidine phosphatase SixA